MAAETDTKAMVFTFLDDAIMAANGDLNLPGTEGLSGVIKRYDKGPGESRMHRHDNQDHTYYVLHGQVAFHLGVDAGRQEKVVVLNRGDAVVMPRDTFYWFESLQDEKLILLRVSSPDGNHRRISPLGESYPYNAENSRKPLPTWDLSSHPQGPRTDRGASEPLGARTTEAAGEAPGRP
ncbi:MAG: cupin domain-containing protein [Chloroflexi bacterium]|nr:cupin domain-containing protein [Chloroflexota bacterium]